MKERINVFHLLPAVVVLPTPPFPEVTVTTLPIVALKERSNNRLVLTRPNFILLHVFVSTYFKKNFLNGIPVLSTFDLKFTINQSINQISRTEAMIF